MNIKIYNRENGMLSVTIIDNLRDQRITSTILHNCVRGSHDMDFNE